MEGCKLRYFNSFEFFDHTGSKADQQTSMLILSRKLLSLRPFSSPDIPDLSRTNSSLAPRMFRKSHPAVYFHKY